MKRTTEAKTSSQQSPASPASTPAYQGVSVAPPVYGIAAADQPSAILQPKLRINAPGDRYEQEADRIADQLMHLSGPPPAPLLAGANPRPDIQRECAACEAEDKEEEEGLLMRKAESGGGYEASPALTAQLQATKGGGAPLPEGTRSFMESAIGTDFSGVRVHTDAQAAEMSRGIQARAFTHGQDIYFNRGEYAPESAEGRRLLGHELVHVGQGETGLHASNGNNGNHSAVGFIQRRPILTPNDLGLSDSSPGRQIDSRIFNPAIYNVYPILINYEEFNSVDKDKTDSSSLSTQSPSTPEQRILLWLAIEIGPINWILDNPKNIPYIIERIKQEVEGADSMDDDAIASIIKEFRRPPAELSEQARSPHESDTKQTVKLIGTFGWRVSIEGDKIKSQHVIEVNIPEGTKIPKDASSLTLECNTMKDVESKKKKKNNSEGGAESEKDKDSKVERQEGTESGKDKDSVIKSACSLGLVIKPPINYKGEWIKVESGKFILSVSQAMKMKRSEGAASSDVQFQVEYEILKVELKIAKGVYLNGKAVVGAISDELDASLKFGGGVKFKAGKKRTIEIGLTGSNKAKANDVKWSFGITFHF